jgi:uncharacterized protein with PIN domain/sulfur carrier protein ThiS
MSLQINIRFYEELNDFLPMAQRKLAFDCHLRQSGSVKDLIESLGVPHTEVDLILVNGESVDFNYIIQDGDRISVYPVFETLDITPVVHLRPKPLRETRFVLDVHLGRLAAYLRMLGFDTLYRNDLDDSVLADISIKEHRILLTCDKQLLMRKQITHAYYVREREPQKQLLEILSRFNLYGEQQPFSRCMHCNGAIHLVTKKSVESHLMPRTREYYNEFWQCDKCRKIYWKGSHYQRMQKLIAKIT